MRRLAALWLAACSFAALAPTARSQVPPAPPFANGAEVRAPEGSHRAAYASMAVGATLVGLSFHLAHRADQVYEEYLDATEPSRIESLYDRAVRYDRWGRATLIGGEGMLALGLYLRFVRHPLPARMSLEAFPNRCALSVRF